MVTIRVFPRRTKATPVDNLSRVGMPGLFDKADEVHISVAWTWDLNFAEKLAKAWEAVAPVKIGGPAVGMAGGDFTPGTYLRPGYTITSRGCPNRCGFCEVWKRDGITRELPIKDGWNILDDNLLACSDEHIMAVFSMLSRQKRKPEFTGGLEARRLKFWHVAELRNLKPKQLFFAYDEPSDYEPLVEAGKLLINGGFTKASHVLRCYVLCGWEQGDEPKLADMRMRRAAKAGFMPMAMLVRDKETGKVPEGWTKFQHEWTRPAIIAGAMKW